MKARNKLFITIILILLLTVPFVFKQKNIPATTNVVISYADSIVMPKNISKEEEYDLVDLSTLDTNFIIELRYATENNFAGKEFYPKIAKAYLKKSTAEKLKAANEELFQLGYRIKIYDGKHINYNPLMAVFLICEVLIITINIDMNSVMNKKSAGQKKVD